MTATTPARSYERAADELRPTTIEPGSVRTATGSALISMGETRVICTASEEGANVEMDGAVGVAEVQGTAGRIPLFRAALDGVLRLAASAIERVRGLQDEAVAARSCGLARCPRLCSPREPRKSCANFAAYS